MRDRDLRRDQCTGCGARLMFVAWLHENGTLGKGVPRDPTADLSSGVRASMAWHFDRRLERRVGFRTGPNRPRPEGWRATTIRAATCSAARRRDVPANERPVGDGDLVEDPTLFDHDPTPS